MAKKVTLSEKHKNELIAKLRAITLTDGREYTLEEWAIVEEAASYNHAALNQEIRALRIRSTITKERKREIRRILCGVGNMRTADYPYEVRLAIAEAVNCGDAALFSLATQLVCDGLESDINSTIRKSVGKRQEDDEKDLRQECYRAILDRLRFYNPDEGRQASISTFLHNDLRQAVNKCMANMGGQYSKYTRHILTKIKIASTQMAAEGNSNPTVVELTDYINQNLVRSNSEHLTEQQVTNALEYQKDLCSIDEVGEVASDNVFSNPEGLVMIKQLKEELYDAIKRLPIREQDMACVLLGLMEKRANPSDKAVIRAYRSYREAYSKQSPDDVKRLYNTTKRDLFAMFNRNSWRERTQINAFVEEYDPDEVEAIHASMTLAEVCGSEDLVIL